MREDRSGAGTVGDRGRSAFDRGNPLNWLIFGGILLIASIVIGTAITVLNFRERALNNSARELENTVLLLARHFDRELHDFDAVQRDVVRRIERSGVASPDEFRRRTSGEAFHTDLQGAVDALSNDAAISVFDAGGQLINSSQFWPVPDLNIADRGYFRDFAMPAHSQRVQLAAVNRGVKGG